MFLKVKSITWYQMEAKIKGMNMTKTSQATIDITVIVPTSRIVKEIRFSIRVGIRVSTALWSVEHYMGGNG